MSNSFSASSLGYGASRASAVPTTADELIRAVYTNAVEYVAHAADPSHTGGSLARIGNNITRYGRALDELGTVESDLATNGTPVHEYPDADAYLVAVNAARDARIAGA